MASARFRFENGLQDHLQPGDRGPSGLIKCFHTPGSVKDAIESFGIPHTEVEHIAVNGAAVDFEYLVQDGDAVVAHGATHTYVPKPLRDALRPEDVRFVLDVHLGRLAAYLRMLGFDAAYRSCFSDPEIARISADERRILLTRDRGLLMRNSVVYGYWLRNTDSRLQTEEILRRFELVVHARPWTRCMACNGNLRSVEKTAIIDRLPERTAELHDRFSECARCRRVYWKGSHYARMQRWMKDLLQVARQHA